MKELWNKIKNAIFGPSSLPKCERCKRRAEKSMYYRDRYVETKKKLQESEEILNLAIDSLDLRKAKHKALRTRYLNR